jgi:hypothetical protein
MSIGSIYSAKELAATYQSLLLCEWELWNGTFLRLSTHALATGYNTTPTSGSYEYGGVPWIPRILNQDIAATQAMSDMGVDVVPTVSVLIADPDKEIFTYYEQAIGFKGATLTIYAVMWDAGNLATGSFSSDFPAPIKFIGTCSAAMGIDDRTIVVTATSLLNMTQQQMPPIRIQPLCPWQFPPDAASRLDGLTNSDSPYYQCGYSVDQAGGVGNYESGTAAFTSCDYAKSACIERLGDNSQQVPIIQDENGNPTGRFGGFDYVPVQNNGLQRAYTTGQWTLIINATNEARYGDYVSICYGFTWVVPEIMGVYGDGNYTRFEALLDFGKVNQLITLVVNGDVVPQLAADVTDRPSNYISSPSPTTDYLDNYWVTVNNGNRNGLCDEAVGWNGQGDPYGNFSAIQVQVLAQLAASSSLPQVQALVQAGSVRVYTDVNTYTYQFSSNPAWVLMDLLVRANWRYSQINIQSFISAAAVCDEQIYFNRLDGAYANVFQETEGIGGDIDYHRYMVGFTVTQRTAIGQLIQGVRNAMRGMLFFDFNTGLLTVMNKQTLANQQPAPITGSNYNTPVSSVTAAGMAANGYVAYSFDGSSILKDASGKSTLKITQQNFSGTPNKSTIYFFDRENQYNQDISTIIDTEDVGRIGAEVVGTFNLVGPTTFDQINRLTDTWYSENYRGNPRLDFEGSAIGDTGGTLQFEFETSIKGIHLMVGQICLISDAQGGFTNYRMRIMKIQPSQNFETAKIVGWYQNDNWYQDTYGQGANQPIYKSTLSAADTNPRSWLPNYEVPQSGDAYYQPSDLGFGVAQSYGVDPNGNPLAQLQITGEVPVNAFPTIPLAPALEIIGVGDTGGGYPEGTAYFAGIAALGADGSISPLSNLCPVSLSISQDALQFVNQGWPPTAVGYLAFAGFTPNSISYQASASFTGPGLITLDNDYNYGSFGPPDQAFSSFVANIREEIHAGVIGAQVLSVTDTTIQLSVYTGYGFSTNQFAGYEVSVLGIQWAPPNPTYTPIANFTIASNTADTLTLSAGNPTTCVYGQTLNPGDVVTIRMKPTFGQDSGGYYFEDANLVNALNQIDEQYAVFNATNATPIVVTIVPQGSFAHGRRPGQGFPFHNGQTVVLQNVTGNTAANGGWVISNCNAGLNHFTLVGSAGNGVFTGGGWAAAQTPGLIPNAEQGNFAFIIKGTGVGTSAKIASNTSTKVYIAGAWPITPDETSRVVILSPVITSQALASAISNSVPQFQASYTANVLNFGEVTLFVQVSCVNPTGLISLPVLDPFRELFCFGNFSGANVVVATANITLTGAFSIVNCDTTYGSFTVTLPVGTAVPGKQFTIIKVSNDANTVTVVIAGGGSLLSLQGIGTEVVLSVQGASAIIQSTAGSST